MRSLLLLIMLCQTLFLLVLRGSRPIVSLYANFLGASPLLIGLLVSSFAFLPMLFAIQTGKWLDYYGAKRIILIGVIGIILSSLFLIWSPTLPMLFFNQTIIGF